MLCLSFIRARFEWTTCKLAVQAIGILMCSRVALAQQVSHIYPYGHFDTLQCVQCQQTQLLVEYVQSDHVFKAAPGTKRSSRTGRSSLADVVRSISRSGYQ